MYTEVWIGFEWWWKTDQELMNLWSLTGNKDILLKDKFPQKWKFSLYLLPRMQMESRVKFQSPRKHFWS